MPAKKDFWAYDLFTDSIIELFATVIIATVSNGSLCVCRRNMRQQNVALGKFRVIGFEIRGTTKFYSVYFFYGIMSVAKQKYRCFICYSPIFFFKESASARPLTRLDPKQLSSISKRSFQASLRAGNLTAKFTYLFTLFRHKNSYFSKDFTQGCF